MAIRNEKDPGSAAGRFYVDASCIDCDMCRETAPAFFHRNDDIGPSVVYAQPASAADLAAAEEALRDCPTESIGNDG